MADEGTKAPVTDSRFPGFNPEVEESHAQAEAASGAAPAPERKPETPPAKQRPPFETMIDLFHEIADHLGNHPRLTELLKELDDARKE